jgi:hypothetical protein
MSFDFKIVNGDLAIGSDGDLEKVENEAKLIQDILKMILTKRGSKRLYPWYGTDITGGGIGNAFDFQFTSTFLQSQAKNAIEMLSSLQKQQEKIQYLSPEESISAIKNVGVQERFNDPRFIDVYVKVINKAFRSTTIPFSISAM